MSIITISFSGYEDESIDDSSTDIKSTLLKLHYDIGCLHTWTTHVGKDPFSDRNQAVAEAQGIVFELLKPYLRPLKTASQ